MTRPTLDPVPLTEVFPLRAGAASITMSPGQWDALLAAAYDGGWTLIEVDDTEHPVRAYRRPATEATGTTP